MHDFTYLRPDTLAEAFELYRDAEGDAQFLAGGTALVLTMRRGFVVPSKVIVLHNVDRMRGISLADDGALRIGALTIHSEVAQSELVRLHVPVFANVAARLANPQVRNQGTLGGNLCYADPATDPATCLLALGATVTIFGPDGERSLAMSEFIVDYFETALEEGEILTEIVIPPVPAGAVSGYRRFLRTAAEHRPLVTAALVAERDGPVVRNVRLAVGASTPAPVRAEEAEELLSGTPISPDLCASAANAVTEAVEVISDSRGDDKYRRRMIGVVVRRLLEDVLLTES